MDQFAQILVGGVLQGSVFAIVALGISLVYRVTGIINLVQGGFCIRSHSTPSQATSAGRCP